jgi:hypothetical protein
VTATHEYVSAAKGNGSDQQQADKDAGTGGWYLQQADAALVARPETRLSSVRTQAASIAARLETAPVPPRKKVVRHSAPKRQSAHAPHTVPRLSSVPPTPQPSPTAQLKVVVQHNTPTPTPTPIPATSTPTPIPTATPHPVVVAQAKPTASAKPTPSEVRAHATATAVARNLAAAARAHAQSLAQRASLLTYIRRLASASARVKKARTRIEKSAAQADFDPVLLSKANGDIHAATARLDRLGQRLDRTPFASPTYLQLRQLVDSAIVSYRAAAVQLSAAVQNVQNGDQSTMATDLAAAANDLAHADATVKGVETSLNQMS